MVARKTVRFVGFLISVPLALILLFQFRNMIGADLRMMATNWIRISQVVCMFLFILSVGLSFQFEVAGGLVAFLSPLTYILLESFLRGRLIMNIVPMFMLMGGAFLFMSADFNQASHK
ncbi:MAG TPA: hypothetical protein ENN32_00170 [Chloroflexi bacterium]|nr:hypothetical protein [Chloroflexota bacterium]